MNDSDKTWIVAGYLALAGLVILGVFKLLEVF